MATWVIPHEKRPKPDDPMRLKPDAEILRATDTYYRNELADTKNALRTATEWSIAQRAHAEGQEKP